MRNKLSRFTHFSGRIFNNQFSSSKKYTDKLTGPAHLMLITLLEGTFPESKRDRKYHLQIMSV
jgi:hypothetical protein